MKTTILHVISGLGAGKAERMLKRLVLADRGPRASRQVVVSLTDSDMSLQDAGIELHCLGLATLSRVPGALVRLTILVRRIRPDVVITWLSHAHFLATIAAIASGSGASRVVWNVSGSSPNAPGNTRRKRFKLKLLALLSRLPWAIAVDSPSTRRAYEALGYHPRRWFHLYNSARKSATERVLDSYRQLWRFASGVEPFPVRPGLLERAFPWLKKRWVAQVRKRSNATFIAITGSSLKTTTTGLLSHILSDVARIRVQMHNNAFGACVRTLRRVAADDQYVVCEIATGGPGSLKPKVNLLKPSIGIVTLVGLEHYSQFRTYDAVAQEKATLIEALPENGLAVLNYDDIRVVSMASRTKARVVTFGKSGGDYLITNVRGVAPTELRFSICHAGDAYDIATSLTGSHNIIAVAAAFCCAHQLGVPVPLIQERIASFKPVFGRCSVHQVEDGPLFILDTHKGPYYSFYLPINMITQFKAPRKRIVVGQISDAGNTNPKYRDVYRACRLVADQVIFVGDNAHRSKATAEDISLGRFVEKRSVKEAASFIKETAIPGEIILVKSAQNLHLERIFLDFPCEVRCWEQECGIRGPCVRCGKFRLPFSEHKKMRRSPVSTLARI